MGPLGVDTIKAAAGAASMITKIQAAERQLDTAIRLFFENIDLLSAYTLAAASREITDDLCEKQKDEIFQAELLRLGDASEVRLSFREELKIIIKDEFYRDALALFKNRQNFLKHANNDPGDRIDDLPVDELSFVIMFGIRNFTLLEKRLTPAMSIFIHWFGAAKPMLFRKQRRGANNEFYGNIEELQRTFPDLYSKKAFKAMYEGLRGYYQPR